jgi:hypothetical protein
MSLAALVLRVAQPYCGSSDPPPHLPCTPHSSTRLIHSFWHRTPLRNIYIVQVPKQPLGAHDGTLGRGMNTIRKSICMGGYRIRGSCSPHRYLWRQQTTNPAFYYISLLDIFIILDLRSTRRWLWKTVIFNDVTLCSTVIHRCYVEIYCLHLQGRRVSQAKDLLPSLVQSVALRRSVLTNSSVSTAPIGPEWAPAPTPPLWFCWVQGKR